jgi:acyl-CoA synthetase (AMP-forming)/AMP-acid ligase II
VGTLRSKSGVGFDLVKIGGRLSGEGRTDPADQGSIGDPRVSERPDPFTEDGWFVTGDLVEVDGERILGRETDIVNVGGEGDPRGSGGVIQELDPVHEVAVYGEPNPAGQYRMRSGVSGGPSDSLSQQAAIRQIKAHCRRRLATTKFP